MRSGHLVRRRAGFRRSRQPKIFYDLWP